MSQHYLNKRRLTQLLLPLLVFLFSILVGRHYVGGDQIVYIKVYEAVRGESWINGLLIYRSHISTLEVAHFLIISLFSGWLEKIYLFAVLNAGLAYTFVIIFQRLKASIGILVLHLFLNYYMLVLYFSAERLKIALLFALFAILFAPKTKFSIVAAFFSIVSHAQVLIIFASILSSKAYVSSVKFLKNGRMKTITPLYLSASLLALLISAENIKSKYGAYIGQTDLVDIVKILTIFALSIIYSHERQITLIMFIPLFIGIGLFSGDRLNIIAYGFFLLNALQFKRGLNLGLISLTIYFSLKGVLFLINVFEFGNGFGNL